MTKTKAKRNSARRPATTERNGYKVGYGRPPRHTRFRPGRSGNPKGRPKGAKNETTILHEIMNRPIEIRESGRARKISVLAAILLKFAENALKGDPRSATFLLNRYGSGKDTGETPESNQEDKEILAAFVKSIEDRLKTKTRKE